MACEEAGAPAKHKELVLSAGYDDTVRTLIYSGRPMSVRKTAYVASWCVPLPLRTRHLLTGSDAGRTGGRRRSSGW